VAGAQHIAATGIPRLLATATRCNCDEPQSGHGPLSAGHEPPNRDVAEIARDGFVEIGGHTLTHPPLPLLTAAHRRREIEGGKRRCEELTGRQVMGFAYPHGALDDDCRAAVRESGFEWACTTVPGPVQRSSDPHALPRLFVQDWDAATFEAALR